MMFKRYSGVYLMCIAAVSTYACDDDAGNSSPKQTDVPECTSNDQCSDGEICSADGRCSTDEPECADDDQCGQGEVCTGGRCVPDDPCYGHTCQNSVEKCTVIDGEPKCVDPLCDDDKTKECQAQGKVCSSGECEYEKCVGAPPCLQGKICGVDGKCAFENAPQLIVDPISVQETVEGGEPVNISLKLNNEPAGDVKLKCEISDSAEASISCGDVTFSPSNYGVSQTVKLYGLSDSTVDGDKTYKLTITTVSAEDEEFDGLKYENQFTNKDVDVAGIVVKPSLIETGEDGTAATFTVSLSSKPSGDVSFTASSSNTEYGVIRDAVDNELSIRFSPSDWDTPVSVTVTGKDDGDVKNESPHTYQITFTDAVSSDGNYSGMEIQALEALNVDNDAPGVSIRPVMITPCVVAQQDGDGEGGNDGDGDGEGQDGAGAQPSGGVDADGGQQSGDSECVDGTMEVQLDPEWDDTDGVMVVRTNESGLMTTLRMRLNIPTKNDYNVEIKLKPWDDMKRSSEVIAKEEADLETDHIVIAHDDYKTGALLNIGGKPDLTIDGDKAYYVRMEISSDDSEYDELPDIWIKVINANTDFAGLNVETDGTSVDEDSETNKAKNPITMSLSLTSKPQNPVQLKFELEDEDRLAISSDSELYDEDAGTLTFSPDNWDQAQSVAVDGIRDYIDAVDVESKIKIVVSSEDNDYNRWEEDKELTFTVVNVDVAGIDIESAGGTYRENTTDRININVSLKSKPVKKVTLSATVEPDAQAMSIVKGDTLEFTPENWNTPQLVQAQVAKNVTGDKYVRVVFTATKSSGDKYANMSAQSPDFVVIDGDGAGITLSATKSKLYSYDANNNSAQICVGLGKDPKVPITLTLNSSNSRTANITDQTVQFNSSSWETPACREVKILDADGAPSAKSVETITATVTAVDGQGSPYAVGGTTENGLKLTIYQFNYKDFVYNGAAQDIKLKKGKYLFEVWGARGSNKWGVRGGYGGYAKGYYTVTDADITDATNKNAVFKVYVGGYSDAVAGGFNGGGAEYGEWAEGCRAATVWCMGAGGGGTDIRKTTDLKTRIIVAGGGGGGGYYSGHKSTGGYGGGTTSAGQQIIKSSGWAIVNSGNIGADQNGGSSLVDRAIDCNGANSGGWVFSAGKLGVGGAASGGGYYGGNSYHIGCNVYSGSGGSSYIGGVVSGSTTPNNWNGHGKAKITFVDE